MMRHMPAIPESTRSSIILRLLDHAEQNWPQLAKVRARYHGSFAYITGVLRDGQQIPLFRLRYGGSAHSLGFAIYSAAHGRSRGPGGPPRQSGPLSDEGVAHRAERRCSEGEEGFVEAPERECRTPGG